jgi:hypothetical protein
VSFPSGNLLPPFLATKHVSCGDSWWRLAVVALVVSSVLFYFGGGLVVTFVSVEVFFFFFYCIWLLLYQYMPDMLLSLAFQKKGALMWVA